MTMAWNPSPKVADCREIARKWGGKHQVIVLAIDCAAGTLEMATYGHTHTRGRRVRMRSASGIWHTRP